jgi:hypothetical protein
MRDVEPARQRFELLAAQMKNRAEAGGAIGEFPRVFPDQSDEGKGTMRANR